ncbi:aminopeptidase P N-terminal domain-containing protein, partial [candidate division KSB1 bacterium]|nr:aminopeptidase P N-terminal domain-containing protein [candidate division KSB1 bacterium]
MKSKKLIFLTLIFSFCCFSDLHAITPNSSLARRQSVIAAMSPKGLVILQTNRQGYRYGFGFQQESNLFCLTGMSEPDIVLILSKAGIPDPNDESSIVHSVLVANPPAHQASNSDAYFQALQDSLGFDLVCGTKEYRKIFKSILAIDTLYTNIITKNQKDGKTILENRLIKLMEELPQIEIATPGRLTASLR